MSTFSNAFDGALGIVVSGGPAPGLNSAIASITIEGLNRGLKVYGFRRGFEGIISHGSECALKLDYKDVSQINGDGGSIIGTSRCNPLKTQNSKNAFVSTLEKLEIDKLVVIGGEGSAYVSYSISQEFPALKIVHLPKTIDNDLCLPGYYPSFGYETARYAGETILRTLITDAITTERWFVITTMGRKAGFLALGAGLSAGSTLTLIPEEFEQNSITHEDIAEIILHSIQTRLKAGKNYGTAILAEGILEKFDFSRIPELKDCPRDDMGRIQYTELELEDLVTAALRRKLVKAGLNIRIVKKNIGYELRCHDPVSFDIEYTKFLGYGAVNYLLKGASACMIVRDDDQIGAIPLASMLDANGSIRSRTVDLKSDLYKVARSFMIR